MRKFFYIAIAFFLFFGCKKNTSTSTKASTQTATSSFSIDGKPVNNPTHSSFNNGGNYGVIAYGDGGNPGIQITFYGTVAPAYGNYAIVAGTVSYSSCTFTLSDTGYTSSASSGLVKVVTSNTTPNNTLSFTNVAVSGNAGHHVLSGTITY